ncbi:MAG TPA: hypothetical protein P5060_01545 [Candidatus Absconditabacterales bacterium]|nr:hypothetical protein [Candidatus Absconditabacterales bacterium]
MIEKREVIDTYIEKQKEDSLFGTINNFLGSLGIDKKIDSPFGGQKKINEYIDLYLGGEVESDENQKESSENIKDNVTEQLGGLKGSVRLALLETELSITCGYFSELKELLDIIKEEKIELSKLKNNIENDLPFDSVSDEEIIPQSYSLEENPILDGPYRERISTSLDNLLKLDEENPIKYVRGGDDVDKEGGLDCSGMVDYIIKQAGGQIMYNGRFTGRNTAREYFQDFDTIKVLDKNEANNKKEAQEISYNRLKDMNLQRGDLLYRDSINPRYRRSTGSIPPLTKNGKEHRIHHIAIIESINSDGTINVVESNGSQGVTKSIIDPRKRLKSAGKKKSELYVSKMDYSKYFQNEKIAA